MCRALCESVCLCLSSCGLGRSVRKRSAIPDLRAHDFDIATWLVKSFGGMGGRNTLRGACTVGHIFLEFGPWYFTFAWRGDDGEYDRGLLPGVVQSARSSNDYAAPLSASQSRRCSTASAKLIRMHVSTLQCDCIATWQAFALAQ